MSEHGRMQSALDSSVLARSRSPRAEVRCADAALREHRRMQSALDSSVLVHALGAACGCALRGGRLV